MTTRDRLRHLHVVVEAIVEGMCRANTKRAKRAQNFFDVRTALLALLEGIERDAADAVADAVQTGICNNGRFAGWPGLELGVQGVGAAAKYCRCASCSSEHAVRTVLALGAS